MTGRDLVSCSSCLTPAWNLDFGMTLGCLTVYVSNLVHRLLAIFMLEMLKLS